MRIIWNGTGSAWANRLGNASAIIEAGGQRLLIDCGHSVPGRLRQMGLSLRDIDAVFVSHLHGDHIYGLEEWGFRSLLKWGIKPHLLLGQDLALPLWRHVLSGTMAFTCDRNCLLRDYFEVGPMHVSEPISFGPWTLEIRPVRHVPHASAYGVKVSAEGVAVSFTCDSLADADPWFYENTALVFHDCSFQPVFPGTIHAHYEELKLYPQEFRAKTVLVHYDDDIIELSNDPEWQADLAASGMCLAEPFVPIDIR